MNNLLEAVPNIKRARGYRLYTQTGKRLVDLSLCGGRLLFGHKSRLFVKELKNLSERGLLSPLPSIYCGRFIKALSTLFPEKTFRYYDEVPQSVQTLLKKIDPDIPLWRPYSKFADGEWKQAQIFRAILPCIFSPQVFVIDKNFKDDLAPSPILPPYVLAATTRSIYDIFANKKKIKYITLNVDDEEYTAIFKKFLEQGFLIPPLKTEPIILHEDLNEIEMAKLKKLLTVFRVL